MIEKYGFSWYIRIEKRFILKITINPQFVGVDAHSTQGQK